MPNKLKMLQMITIEQGSFPWRWADISHIRKQVFILEQGVSAADEWDGGDKTAMHFVLSTPAAPIACARLLQHTDGRHQIGRMAVLKHYRKQGYGRQLIQAIIDYHLNADKHPSPLFLHAQLQALDFYKREGFIEQGEEFLDAEIVHKTMIYLP